ncbi:MAG: hypothetical protein AAAB21_20215 [Pseudomonas chlororaphis]
MTTKKSFNTHTGIAKGCRRAFDECLSRVHRPGGRRWAQVFPGIAGGLESGFFKDPETQMAIDTRRSRSPLLLPERSAADHSAGISHSIINKQVNLRKNGTSGEVNRTRP